MKAIVFLFVCIFMAFGTMFAASADSIKVGVVLAKSGKAALDNSQTLMGIRNAVRELNHQGGVLGRQINLLEFDNQSSTLSSRKAAAEAVSRDVTAVIGAVYSSHSLAMASVLQEAKIPMISPFATNPEVTLAGNYIFRICFIDPFQGQVMAEFAYSDLKARTAVVLINATMTYSEGLANYFIQNFKRLGGTILAEIDYLDKTADFTFAVDRIKLLKPEIVFLPGYLKDSGFIIKQAREAGVTARFTGGDGWKDGMYDTVGSVIEGNYYTNHWHPDVSSSISRQFYAECLKRGEPCDAGNALGRDAVYLLADAIRRAGSLNPSSIRDSIAETTGFEGVTGKISLNDNGDPIKPAVILQFLNRASVFIKTVEP